MEILHQCGKKVKTKSQKVLGANSYVGWSYRRKTGKGTFLPLHHSPPSPHILNRVKGTTKSLTQEKERAIITNIHVQLHLKVNIKRRRKISKQHLAKNEANCTVKYSILKPIVATVTVKTHLKRNLKQNTNEALQNELKIIMKEIESVNKIHFHHQNYHVKKTTVENTYKKKSCSMQILTQMEI